MTTVAADNGVLRNAARKLAEPAQGRYGLGVAAQVEPEIDEARMSFWLPFADGSRRDGVGDLLEVGGIDLSRHRANPVTLFDHGKTVALPIGICQDPESGLYTAEIDPISKAARANVFVYQTGKAFPASRRSGSDGVAAYDHGLFCEQVFDLWRRKFIRAGSIGYQVLQAYQLQPDYERGIPAGLHLVKTLMLECSAVVMPANPDTTRKGLGDGFLADSARRILAMPAICGKAPSPYLVKGLSPYAGEAPAIVRGGFDTKSQPSDDIDPDKACQILKDGSVGGNPLTEAQRGMFGAACGRRGKPRDGKAVKALRLRHRRKSAGCFGDADRDEAGHCKPSGTGDAERRRLEEIRHTNEPRRIPGLSGNRRGGPVSGGGGRGREYTHAAGDRVTARTHILHSPSREERNVLFARPGESVTVESVDDGGSMMTVRHADGRTARVLKRDFRRRGKSADIGKRVKGGPSMATRTKELPRKAESADADPMPGVEAPLPDEVADGVGNRQDEPYGAQVLRRLHEDHTILLQDYDEMLGPLENEGIKEQLHELLADIDAKLTAFEEKFEAEYSHLPALADADDSGEAEDEAEDEAPPDDSDLGDAVGDGGGSADSVDEDFEEPDPEEVVAGMRTKSVPVKELRAKHRKGLVRCKPGQIKRESGCRPDGAKAVCPGCGKEGCRCQAGKAGEKVAPAVAAAAPAVMEAIGPEVAMAAAGEALSGDQEGEKALDDRERGVVGEASGFLRELSSAHEFGEEGRQRAYHYHKTFDGIAKLAEAHEDLESGGPTPPPAEFDPGAGAKSGPAPTQTGHRKMCGECGKFFSELSKTRDLTDDHRGKAAYWHRALEPIAKPPEAAGAVEPGAVDEKSLADAIAAQDRDIAQLTDTLSRLANAVGRGGR